MCFFPVYFITSVWGRCVVHRFLLSGQMLFGQRLVFNYSPWSTRLSLLVSLWFVHTYFVMHGWQGANPADVRAYSTQEGNSAQETLGTGWTLYLCHCCCGIKQKEKRSKIFCTQAGDRALRALSFYALWPFYVLFFLGLYLISTFQKRFHFSCSHYLTLLCLCWLLSFL